MQVSDRLDLNKPDNSNAARLAVAANEMRDYVVDLAVQIAEVAAPTNDEMRRSVMAAELMREHGYANIESDEIGDVVGTLPGSRTGSPLLLAAHLDTVFPLDVPIVIERKPGKICGPGIGDNSLGLAAVVALPKLLKSAELEIASDVLATGNVGEEGLGDLRGIRTVLDAHPEVGAVVAVEGHNLGRVTNVAVGSRRLRVTVSGPGGHSWGDAGKPNAIQAASELITQMSRIRLQSNPKTTFNVGTINGGISVNTIAPEVSFVLDLRSVSETALHSLEQRVREILRRPPRGVDVAVELIGDRPAGQAPVNSPIMQHAMTVLRGLGVEPMADASSTDANIAINRGIPAICIGLTTGGNVHRVDEFIETEPIAAGLYQLAALTYQLSHDLAERS